MSETLSGIAEAVSKAGSQSALARQLGVSQAAIWEWLQAGYVPLSRVTEVEALYGIARSRLVHPKYLIALPVQFSTED